MSDRQGTLPDLLREGLDIVFVGINPSCYSVERGHYFARKTNRFWPCLSRSVLSKTVRAALSVEMLDCRHDRLLLDHGIGFTDLVKRATPMAGDITTTEFAAGVREIIVKLEHYRPRIACFQGITAYRHVHRLVTGSRDSPVLGLQDLKLGPTQVFLVPNPSAANAGFKPSDQTRWYDLLAACLDTKD